MRYFNLKTLIMLSVLMLSVTLLPTIGQGETVITIAIPDWQQSTFNDALFDEFEAAHPGVNVVPVFETPGGFFFNTGGDEEALDESFDYLLESTTSADVLSVQPYSMSVEMTRAGFFLDLAPLISNDPSFDTDDFFPAAWQSYQWDRGIWAVPTNVNPLLLIYDAAKFDEAGLPYPSENWTLTDLLNAAEAFAEYDDEGNVTLPGLAGMNVKFLLLSLMGEGFLDQDVIPNGPRLNTPELQALMDAWKPVMDSGIYQMYGDFDVNEVAMSLDYTYRLQSFSQQDNTKRWAASLLPGGKAGLDVTGFAISAGTAHPELAYELVKFLSQSPVVSAASFGSYPARQSLVGVVPEDMPFSAPEMSDTMQTAFESALENGIPVADTQFYNYIQTHFEVFPGMPDDAIVTATPPLEEIQQNVLSVLAAAEARRTSQVIAVATAVPTPVLQQGEIVLRFQLGMPFSPLPNRELWEDFLAEFAANDPIIGNIDFLTGFGSPAQGDEVDCYYTSDNMVPSADLSTLMALDPFLDADPDFDESDVLGNTLAQLQRENATYGYPMTLQPALISYNTELFEEAGVTVPQEGWTIDQFAGLVDELVSSDLDIEYAFDTSDFGPTHLYMFIAAYGGRLADYSTTPATYHLTDPETINAIRQTLDLAKQGYIRYRPLDNNMGGGGFSGNLPLQATNMVSMAWELGYRVTEDGQNNPFVSPNRYILYPRGTQATPLSYTVGTGYITSTSADPEACYRLLTEISRRPDLLLGVPARRSLLEDPQIATLFGDEIAAFFNMFAEQLDEPDALIVPGSNSFSGSYTAYFESIWINQAFDNYVLENGDLEVDLALAETNIAAYRTCVGDDTSPVDINSMEQAELEAYFAKYTECAVEVDPTLQGRFGE